MKTPSGIALVLSVGLLWPPQTDAKEEKKDSLRTPTGACEGALFKEMTGKPGRIDTSQPLRVLRTEATSFRDRSATVPKGTLFFGDLVFAERFSGSPTSGLIEVRKEGEKDASGWMKREDLLCHTKPLRNENDLERKLFIKTPPETKDEKQYVRAYPSPDSDECAGKCRELSRFEMFYIFAEDFTHRRVLLAEYYNIDDGAPLVGWVNKDDGIFWNTRLGIRPSDTTTSLQVYESMEDARQSSLQPLDRGISLPGGDQWYSYEMRLALIDKEEEHYKVAAPGVGAQAFEDNEAIENLEELKKVDVFFVLDGTKSMGPNLSEVRAAVTSIIDLLSRDTVFNETYFRFGFRVYRDLYDGNNGIGEGLELPSDSESCENRREQSLRYKQLFDRSLQRVSVSSDDALKGDETATESLFNGLLQAAEDIASCPKHTKLIFVIGDAGDNAQGVPGSVISRLRSYRRIVPFFIKTRHLSTNDVAFQRFGSQALEILTQVVPPKTLDGRAIRSQDLLLPLDDTNLSKRILGFVKKFSQTASVNEAILAIRSGQSPNDFLRSQMNEDDLPVLYWELVRDVLCGEGTEAEEKCEERVDHRVIEGFAPVNPLDGEWIEELWITSIDLESWLFLLRSLSEIQSTASRQKEDFIAVLRDKLQQLLGPPPITEEDVPLQEFLQRRAGLPTRELSPLMQYSIQELRDLENCELNRLISFVRTTRQILLSAIATPDLKISVDRQKYKAGICTGISEKGKGIPLLVIQSPEPFDTGSGNRDPRTYRYSRKFRGETRFWLPKEFFP